MSIRLPGRTFTGPHERHPIGVLIIGIVLALGTVTGCSENGDPVTLFYDGHYDEALEIFRRKAASGDLDAMNFVGIHYYMGVGAKRDFVVAREWFEKAALGQNSSAQRNLGVMYLRGYGTEKDHSLAYGWLHRALRGGNPTAEKYLGFVGVLITPNESITARKRIAARINAVHRSK